jgi:hypothetical protein
MKESGKAAAVIVLPMFERDDDRYFNSAIVIDADGPSRTPTTTYRTYLSGKKFYFSVGDRGLPVFQTKLPNRRSLVGQLFPEATGSSHSRPELVLAPCLRLQSQHIWQAVITRMPSPTASSS